MAWIDALHLEDPCSGSRLMVDYLTRDGIPISRYQMLNLLRRMGLRAINQKPRTTVTGNPSERFTWLVDLYLLAIMDLSIRSVLSWKLSNSLDTWLCLDGLEMALEGGRKPEIFHSEQGVSSPNSNSWLGCRSRRSKSAGQIRSAATTISSLNGRWRAVKYKGGYLRAYCYGGRMKSAWAISWRVTAM
jgi:putative transposase